MLNEKREKENETSLKDLSVLREKVTEEIDAMTTNQLRGMSTCTASAREKDDEERVSQNIRKRRSERVVGNDEVHGRTKKNREQRPNIVASWDHQPQEEGVLVVRDSLGCGAGRRDDGRRSGKGKEGDDDGTLSESFSSFAFFE